MRITPGLDEDHPTNLAPSPEFTAFQLILILHPQKPRPMTHALSYQAASPFNILRLFLQAAAKRPLSLVALVLGLFLGLAPLATTAALASAVTGEPLADGVYAFGDRPEADQIGATYMVMAVNNGDVVGGFYQPASSFDCFSGQIAGQTLDLTVVNSYEQTEHPFSLAMEANDPVASQAGGVTQWVPTGFHALTELSDTDRTVLQVCQAQG